MIVNQSRWLLPTPVFTIYDRVIANEVEQVLSSNKMTVKNLIAKVSMLSKQLLHAVAAGSLPAIRSICRRHIQLPARPAHRACGIVSRWLWTVLRPIKNLTLLTP